MNKHNHILRIIIVSFIALFTACSPKSAIPVSEEINYKEKGYVPATVINYTVDGCTWMLKLDNDKKLQPLELKPEFQRDNLDVWIKYVIKKGAVGICMAGEIVSLTEIVIRK